MADLSNHETWKQLLASASPASREPTPACPPLPSFGGWHPGGKAAQRYGVHAQTCGYCRRHLQIAARVEHQTLFAGLNDWSEGRLKSLTIIRSWWDGSPPEQTSQDTWDRRLQDFGMEAAEQVWELLTRARGYVGVASGETLHWAVTAMAALPPGPPRPDPLTCLATVGDLVYGLRHELNQHIHSSTLAKRLERNPERPGRHPLLDHAAGLGVHPEVAGHRPGQAGHKEVVPIPPSAADRDRTTLRATDRDYRAGSSAGRTWRRRRSRICPRS